MHTALLLRRLRRPGAFSTGGAPSEWTAPLPVEAPIRSSSPSSASPRQAKAAVACEPLRRALAACEAKCAIAWPPRVCSHALLRNRRGWGGIVAAFLHFCFVQGWFQCPHLIVITDIAS